MPVITAHITRITRNEGSDFADIFTDYDQGKFSTKIPEIVADAVAAKKSGALAEIEFNESTREKDGRTYHNRYLKRVSAAEPEPEPDIEIVPASALGRKTDPEDAWRMSLAAGSKLAIGTLPMLPEGKRSFELQRKLALAWASFIFFTPSPDGFQAAVAVSSGDPNDPEWGSAGEQPVPHYGHVPNEADDIPFD